VIIETIILPNDVVITSTKTRTVMVIYVTSSTGLSRKMASFAGNLGRVASARMPGSAISAKQLCEP
jgi:hypothetical protein